MAYFSEKAVSLLDQTIVLREFKSQRTNAMKAWLHYKYQERVRIVG